MDVRSHADEVYRAVGAVDDVLFVIATTRVSHHCDFERGVVVANYGADVVVVAEFPFAESVDIKHSLVCLVAKFHIIDPGGNVGLVERVNKFVAKPELVDKSAVPERGVHHLDARTVIH